MQRRQLLRHGFILVAGTGGEPLYARYAPRPGTPIPQLDPGAVATAVNRTAELRVRDNRDGAEAVLDDATRHAQRVLDAVRRSHPKDPSHLPMLVAAAEAVHVLGVTVVDLCQWPTADNYFLLANRLARRAYLADASRATSAPDLQALALGMRARLFAARNRDDLAIQLLTQLPSAELSPEAKSYVQFHIALAHGRAAASNRDPSERREKVRLALSAFDRAEAELDKVDRSRPHRFPTLGLLRPVTVAGHVVPVQANFWRGHVYAKLASTGLPGWPQRADDLLGRVPTQRAGNRTFAGMYRGTGELLLDIAESAAHAGDRRRAYALAGSALDVFSRVRSRRLIARMRVFVPELGRLFSRRDADYQELLGSLTKLDV